MLNFRKYMLLNEKIEKTDIIDLYIIMAMPKIEDPAYAYIAQEVQQKTIEKIKTEAQHVIIRELKHMNLHTDEGNAIIEYQRFFDYVPTDIRTKFARFPRLSKQAKEYIRHPILDATNLEPEKLYKEIQNISQQIFKIDISPVLFLKRFSFQFNWLDKIMRSKRRDDGNITFEELAKETQLPWDIDVAISAFTNLAWDHSFGGPNWTEATIQVKNLLEATGDNVLLQLDRFIDFVHNTGAVATKFTGYEDGWLYYILDIKAQAINIRELIPYASRDVQKLFRTQEWRMLMTKIPGKGASESFEGIKNILRKYLPTLTLYVKNYLRLPTFTPLSLEDPLEENIDEKKWKMEGIQEKKLISFLSQITPEQLKHALEDHYETDELLRKRLKQFMIQCLKFNSDTMQAPESVIKKITKDDDTLIYHPEYYVHNWDFYLVLFNYAYKAYIEDKSKLKATKTIFMNYKRRKNLNTPHRIVDLT